MSAKFDEKINKRILEYLAVAGIPAHAELKSSHSMRRLYVSFAYSLRENHSWTFEYFVLKMLGHSGSGSVQNYNSIKITSDKLLDKDSASKLNLTYKNTIQLQDEITKLEKKIDDIEAPVAPTQTVNEIAITKLRPETQRKFKQIKELLEKGVVSYKDMKTKGISKNMYTNYKNLLD